MKENKFWSNLALVAGFASITLGLGLIYPPLVYIFWGVSCLVISIGFSNDKIK